MECKVTIDGEELFTPEGFRNPHIVKEMLGSHVVEMLHQRNGLRWHDLDPDVILGRLSIDINQARAAIQKACEASLHFDHARSTLPLGANTTKYSTDALAFFRACLLPCGDGVTVGWQKNYLKDTLTSPGIKENVLAGKWISGDAGASVFIGSIWVSGRMQLGQITTLTTPEFERRSFTGLVVDLPELPSIGYEIVYNGKALIEDAMTELSHPH